MQVFMFEGKSVDQANLKIREYHATGPSGLPSRTETNRNPNCIFSLLFGKGTQKVLHSKQIVLKK